MTIAVVWLTEVDLTPLPSQELAENDDFSRRRFQLDLKIPYPGMLHVDAYRLDLSRRFHGCSRSKSLNRQRRLIWNFKPVRNCESAAGVIGFSAFLEGIEIRIGIQVAVAVAVSVSVAVAISADARVSTIALARWHPTSGEQNKEQRKY
jgi:hypothetical protein